MPKRLPVIPAKGATAKCAHLRVICIDSRPQNNYRRRRYECEDCRHRYSTAEFEIDLISGNTLGDIKASLKGGVFMSVDTLAALRSQVIEMSALISAL